MPTLTTRFLTNNVPTKLFGYLSASSGPIATDPNYPLANLLVPDRYVTTSFQPATGDVALYMDLGGTKAISHFGVFNLSVASPNVTPYQFRLYAAPTVASLTVAACSLTINVNTITRASGSFITDGVVVGMGVSGTGIDTNGAVIATVSALTLTMSSVATSSQASITASFWLYTLQQTAVGTIGSKDGLDISVTLTSILSARRVMVMALASSNGFSLGNVLLGTVSADLGIAFSPGTQNRYVRTRTSAPTVNGVLVKSEPGRPHGEFSYVFKSVPVAIRDALLAVAKKDPPIYLLDAYDSITQVDLAEDSFTWTTNWGTPDQFDLVFSLRGLA